MMTFGVFWSSRLKLLMRVALIIIKKQFGKDLYYQILIITGNTTNLMNVWVNLVIKIILF